MCKQVKWWPSKQFIKRMCFQKIKKNKNKKVFHFHDYFFPYLVSLHFLIYSPTTTTMKSKLLKDNNKLKWNYFYCNATPKTKRGWGRDKISISNKIKSDRSHPPIQEKEVQNSSNNNKNHINLLCKCKSIEFIYSFHFNSIKSFHFECFFFSFLFFFFLPFCLCNSNRGVPAYMISC